MSRNATTSMETKRLRPQSLIFTLFGDYICHHGHRIRIRSLIKLLGQVDVSEQAVRSAVSRMVRRGWLDSARLDGASYYTFTAQALQLVEEGTPRILNFRPPEKWNGCWQLVTYSIPETQREARDRFRQELGWLGYGMLANAVWVSAQNQHDRVSELASRLGLTSYVQIFSAQLQGFGSAKEIAARCWNLQAMNAEYTAFIEKYQALLTDFERQITGRGQVRDSEYFVRRLLLIHEYRRFPYRDPNLPPELLPADWQGQAAALLFHRYHQLLAGRANKYFESVFE